MRRQWLAAALRAWESHAHKPLPHGALVQAAAAHLFNLAALSTATMAPSVLAQAAAAPQPHACNSGLHAAACGHTHASCTPSTSNDTSSAARPPADARPKSAKRRAAEALLHRRFSSSGSLAALATDGGSSSSDSGNVGSTEAKRQRTDAQQQQQQHQQQRPAVRVAACSDCGAQAAVAAAASGAAQSDTAAGWCSHDVALPPMDWPAVLQAVTREADVLLLDKQAKCYQLPGDIRVHVVTHADQLPGALSALRASMQDSCIAIDLEWKPEGWCGNGPTRVALMQLASATTAVLVQFCHLGFRMPAILQAFLSDPELVFVGFSWDGADEVKMQQTFGAGRQQLFAHFYDLQQIGALLGYHGFGLGALTKQVLGFAPPKCRKVTMSNWEARQLSARQVQYGALDAIITGHLYRGLRLWHASPSACTSCRQMLGAALPSPEWRCLDCARSFQSSAALLGHKHQRKHRVSPGTCDECGRVHAM